MGSQAILVVDDEPDTGEVVGFLLESYGYHIRYAFNGADALEMLARAPVDLVMTDLMMPILDGSELVRKMRALHEFASTPIIVISATPQDIVRRLCPLADAFISKPASSAQLLDAVRRLLGVNFQG